MPGINEDVSREIEQFLYREARLLDERRFHEWLQLLTDDVRYWMGSRSNRYPKSSKAIAILDPDRYVEDDLTKEDELAILDETKQTLSQRVARLDTGMAWAEDPPSRSRHLITNIEVEPGDAGERGQSLLEFHGLPQPGGDRAGLLRRCPARRPAPNRRGVEDRRSQSDPRPERLAGQERQHLLLSFQAAQIRWLFLILPTRSSARRRLQTAPVAGRSAYTPCRRKTDSNSRSHREGKVCGEPLQASIAVSDLNL